MAEWIGYMVSIQTEAKGTYQGEISAATGTEITLSKPFCDGIPCLNSEITIKAQTITNLQFIEKQESPSGQSTVTVAKPIPKRAARTTSFSEIASSNKSGIFNGNHSFNKSKPIDIDVNKQQNCNELLPNSFNKNRKDKSKGKWSKGWKDEQCFGSPLDQIINKEFDFEKNLALFDKQAIWDEINSQKPDVVRQTDHGRRQTNKYRHDENVLASVPTTYRQITVPKQEVCEYVTDEGLIIPCISKTLRNKLWIAADRLGLTWERRIELMGRATTEMALQLVGGGHRLNPHNSHQCPTIVILSSADRQGVLGINAARHLASHGVNTIVYVPSADKVEVKQELALYKLTKNKVVTSVSRLPHVTDLIITSLSEQTDIGTHADLSDWANSNKAPILALDPPSEGTPGISTKYALVPVLPLAHSPENGKIYLCNLGFPLELFQEVGIKYKSPFGSKFVIPLHPNDDS